MSSDFLSDPLAKLAYLPDGALNAPFLLANANLLLKEGELAPAAALFRLIKDHRKYGHCGHYGLGLCFLAAGEPAKAVLALEKALTLVRRAYIAASLLEALRQMRRFDEVEKRALDFAKEFSGDSASTALFRECYRAALDSREKPRLR